MIDDFCITDQHMQSLSQLQYKPIKKSAIFFSIMIILVVRNHLILKAGQAWLQLRF